MNRHVIGRLIAAAAITVTGVAVAPAPASAAVGLQVWFDANKSGQYRNIQGSISNFDGYNDVVSSVVANGSAWCLFEHKDFGGRQLRVTKGQYIANLTNVGFNDIASSAKRC
ncbi:beta/gamma crystallin-related protein [Micromonospora sp. NPDC049366]|uniref:beta/gamma crystallin-related protein n=1 Tax=Micromonospora sp. NPDC049366 TaxID=3364271 RepID=UPI0037B5F7CC